MRHPGPLVAILLLAGPLFGCRVSASASGSVRSSGEASGAADLDAEREELREPAAEPVIEFRDGHLDYKGVINFEYNRAELQTDAETEHILSEFKDFLAAHPNVTIEVEGHTDSRGSADYNLELSERRAQRVRTWLVEHGVPEDQVTAVGKGEDDPTVPEPPECFNKVPRDTTPCEEAWAENRRVVFEVTKGAAELEAEARAAQEVASANDEPPAEAAPPPKDCPWLWGGHLNVLGPNSWIMGAGATQPGVCWLELSLGLGIGGRGVRLRDAGTLADGSYVSFTVPLRGRFWLMDRHSVIGDLGVGFTHYRISADLDDNVGSTGEYTRRTTPLIGHIGLGYGFRPNGAEAGPRLAIVLGALVHFTDLADSTANTPAGFANAAGLQAAVDRETNALADPEPYGEVSFGWLF
jgi:outer membrane protein OmpA-like peptidoglycan-associated protein